MIRTLKKCNKKWSHRSWSRVRRLLKWGYFYWLVLKIDQFRYIKIQPKTKDLSTRLWEINTEFVGFIPQSLVLWSIVLG